jgi:hypothetical protein
VTADGDEMWEGSGFVAEFDEASIIGIVFSSATIDRCDSCFSLFFTQWQELCLSIKDRERGLPTL